MPKEILEYSASELAREVSAGRVSAREAAKACLVRYDRDLKFSNALVHFDAQEALAALDADNPYTGSKPLASPRSRPVARDGVKGPLAGAQLAVCECLDVAHTITSGGTPALEFNKPQHDAAVVAALVKAGAVVLAHGNTCELDLEAHGHNPLHGTVKNPWSKYGSVGGAAAGVAVAVAGRAAHVGLCVDLLGDARVPSALTGTVGFRPTAGRYSSVGVLSLSSTLAQVGVIARSVEDVQLVDAVLCSSEVESGPGSSSGAPALGGDEAAAAVKIQARARGFLTRKARRGARDADVPAPVPAPVPRPAAAPAASEEERQAAVRIQAIARGRRDRKHVERLVQNKDAAQKRLDSMQAAPSSATAAADSRSGLTSTLRGVRIGVPRAGYFSDLDAAAAGVVEAALDRLRAAGATLVEVAFTPDGAAPAGAVVGLGHAQMLACGLSSRGPSGASHPMDLASDVIEPILAYESIRELSAYLSTHASPAPAPPKKADEEQEPEEDDPAAAAAKARAAAAPKPLDTLTNVTTIVAAFQGSSSDRAMLESQRDSRLAITSTAYRSALVHARPVLKRAFTETLREHRLAALVYPTTPAPALPHKASDPSEVEHNGMTVSATSLYTRNTRSASAAGLPCLSIPCGVTKPHGPPAPGSTAADRLPVALEFVGPAGDDEQLLALGRAFQALQPVLPDPIVVSRWADGVTRRIEI